MPGSARLGLQDDGALCLSLELVSPRLGLCLPARGFLHRHISPAHRLLQPTGGALGLAEQLPHVIQFAPKGLTSSLRRQPRR
jgi:hypothetical protein